MQKIAILIHECRLTVASLLLVFLLHGADVRRATCLCLDCTKNMDKNWNINISLIIHVNFDHAREEHYAVKPCTFSYKFNHGLKVMNMNVHYKESTPI